MASGIGSFFNSTLNGSAGTAQGRQNTTIQTFLISLASGFVLFGVQFTVFLIVRNYLWAKRIYQPRSFLVPVKQRVKPPLNNPFKWLWTVIRIKEDPDLIQKAGLDAYFFVRYLSMCLKLFFPMAIIIIPVLIPLNYKNGKGTSFIPQSTTERYNVTGLDTLAWSNISPTNTDRYWAHLILAVGVTTWVCYVFREELRHYIVLRQKHIGSLAHKLKASSTTVLIQDVPKAFCSEEGLQELYGDFPGGVRRIWMNQDFSTLVEKDSLRKKYEALLENAETDMLRKATKKSRKKSQLNTEIANNRRTNSNRILEEFNGVRDPSENNRQNHSQEETTTKEICQKDLQYDIESNAAWTKYIKTKERKTMKIPNLKHPKLSKVPLISLFFSRKVDTIYFCRRELARLNKEIEEDVSNPEKYPLNNSAFIQFNTQLAAQLACQSVADTSADHMTERVIEISPADINWASLNLNWRQRYIRLCIFLVLFSLLVLAFGVISFFTGVLSKASTLAGSTSWLRWIEKLPTWLLSFIQGTLPPLIQVIVLSGPLPILIRAMTNKTRGATTGQQGERSLQLWYFIFLFFELFIIPTISSGLTSLVDDLIHNPGTVTNILATDLPTAANYYFSFLILQALSLSATSLLQTIRLFKYYVIGHVNTPDAVFEKLSWTNLTRIGSNIPWYTTFAVIGLVYSVIAPLMLVFVLITFSLFWVVIKNNVFYCVRTGIVDGAGLFFPSAINQLFTGLYFMQICMIGLFFLVRNEKNNNACNAQGIVMAVVLVCTALYQIWLNNHLKPLFKYAPVRLEVESRALLEEFEAKQSMDAKTISNNLDEKTGSREDGEHENIDVVAQEENSKKHLSPASPRRQPTMRERSASQRSQNFQYQQQQDVAKAKGILERLNRPLDEARLAHLEHSLEQAEPKVGNKLIPRRKDIEAQMMDDPISKIIMQHNDELANLDSEERDMLLSIAFTHPVLRETRPSVWIPMDDLGISDDEVNRTRAFSAQVTIDNRGAYFDKKLRVVVEQAPPDMSQFAFIMPEL